LTDWTDCLGFEMLVESDSGDAMALTAKRRFPLLDTLDEDARAAPRALGLAMDVILCIMYIYTL
jgi:hypothetical protein